MSKAQGDGFRTWTDKGLNDYRKRLNAKLDGMAEYNNKWYSFGDVLIHCESINTLYNPNGSWKWNGWQVTGKEYTVTVFDSNDVTFQNDSYDVHGLSMAKGIFTDRNEANEYFKTMKAYALM